VVTYNVDLMVKDMAARGFLKKDLAKRAGVSAMAVTRFLRRERQTAPMAKKLAKGLGYSVRRYLPDEVAVAS
jgi:transcriptional regulator with XRE-family HTH domain